MSNRYTKLEDGRWGISGIGSPPSPGEVVVVVKRNGSTKAEAVDQIVWSGSGHYNRASWVASIRPSVATAPKITYIKLPSGKWGVRGRGEPPPAVGSTVTVQKRNGEQVIEVIEEIVSTGHDKLTDSPTWQALVRPRQKAAIG